MTRLRQMTVGMLVAVVLGVGTAGAANADDDDDDDDDGHSSVNSVEIWPPTTVSWPPISRPNDEDEGTAPAIPVP